MDERKFIKKCKEFVRNYYNDRVESTDKNGITRVAGLLKGS